MTATPPVLGSVHVRRSPDEACRVFTEEIGQWWPLATHSVAEQPSTVAVHRRPDRGDVRGR